MRLEDFLRDTCATSPAAPAAVEAGGAAIDYRGLDAASEAIAAQLARLGVGAGDRVGLLAPKSLSALASVFGVLKAGGAYVPADHSAPAMRTGGIFSDCEIAAAIVAREIADALISFLAHGGRWRIEPLAATPGGDANVVLAPEKRPPRLEASFDDGSLAYILYTSGSTGRPKGVTHTHRTARAFIDWCSREFSPSPSDVFSSHAPFHFDLSIFDLYVPIKHGASIVLFDATTGKQAPAIAEAIDALGVSVWYSTPSILRLLIDSGAAEKGRLSRLRTVIFAGEVYPPKHLAKLVRAVPSAALYNLYGPTETNVCTYHRTPKSYDEADGPLPIGFPCSGDRARIAGADGAPVAAGEEGELLIAGDSVMPGYWNLPEKNREAFFRDAEGDWYRTGDIVRERPDGAMLFLGRRDRMVKRRGYRVELGEIEAALNRHPDVKEAAVIAAAEEDGELAIAAFVAWAGDGAPSLLQMKKHCSQNVPLYMIPDRFIFIDALPKTSTDKTDYQALKGRV